MLLLFVVCCLRGVVVVRCLLFVVVVAVVVAVAVAVAVVAVDGYDRTNNK